LICKIFFR